MKFTRTIKTALSTAVVGLLALGLTTTPAFAANNANTTFVVSATVVTACIVTATPLSFGTVVPSTTTAVNANSTISVNCSLGDGYTIALTAGTGTGELETARFMTGTSHGGKLNYALSSTAWTGPGTGGTNWGTSSGTVSGTGTGSAAPYTVYGQVSEQTPPVNDAYTDTITVNVTY
jgi:spore coat protein U-like protein